MNYIVNLYSPQKGEINRFLNSFYNKNITLNNELKWNKAFENPIEMVDIISTLMENKDTFNINMWISLDKRIFINITSNNFDQVIRYIYERFPY